MKLLAKFNLIFLVVFGTGGLLISQIAQSYLIENAREEVLEQERLMMASARSVRDYTSDRDFSPSSGESSAPRTLPTRDNSFLRGGNDLRQTAPGIPRLHV